MTYCEISCSWRHLETLMRAPVCLLKLRVDKLWWKKIDWQKSENLAHWGWWTHLFIFYLAKGIFFLKKITSILKQFEGIERVTLHLKYAENLHGKSTLIKTLSIVFLSKCCNAAAIMQQLSFKSERRKPVRCSTFVQTLHNNLAQFRDF